MAKKILDQSIEVLLNSQVILYPTDTVWGIGCDATSIDAVAKIFKLKNKIIMKNHLLFLVLFLFIILSCASKKKVEADVLIKNGIVYNGSDTIPKNVSIAIKGDKIVFVGNEKFIRIKTVKTIDAKGLIVCPGLIDPHTHADKDLIKSSTSHNLPFLMQGVTTVIVGNDGESYFPTIKYKEVFEKNGRFWLL